jgi:signal transduction histidine kinase
MYATETGIYAAALTAACIFFLLILSGILAAIRLQQRWQRLRQQKRMDAILLIEAERQRIAADMHDEVGVLLSVLKHRLQGMAYRQDSNVAASLQEHCVFIDDVAKKVRAVANNMMPQALQAGSLKGALEDLAGQVAENGHIVWHIACDVPVRVLDSTAELHLYRIVQELFSNILKHSGATEAGLELWVKGKFLHVTVYDNGTGFDKRKAGRAQGKGLYNIRGRTGILKGRYNMYSVPGKGTRCEVQVPLQAIKEKNAITDGI